VKKNILKRNITALLIVFIIMFTGLIVYLGYVNVVYGERWFATPYNPRIQNMKTTVKAGDILDRTGRKLLYTDGDGKRRYVKGGPLRESVAHIIGDEYGLSNGAQIMYAKYLYGSDADSITRIAQLLTGEERKGSDISLTIDADLCKAAMDALGKYDGSIVVMNYKTGEILASVSSPSFDPADMADFKEGGGTSELVNRAFSGLYPPGSTFKLITAAALMEYGKEDYKTSCSGSTVVDGNVIHCTGEHGEVDLEAALEHSCNVYFAQSSQELGGGAIKAEAEKFLFNRQMLFADLVMKESVYEAGSSATDTAWSSIGQYHDLITPLHACMIVSSIANGGIMMEPKLLLGVSSGGVYSYEMSPGVAAKPLSNTDALKEMMETVVKSGTGTRAAVKGVTVAGKTGTAEVDSAGKIPNTAWFVGFIEDEEHPVAIAVVMEKAGSGGKMAAPAAQKVLKKALDLGY
jgi:peptidoglycan glycosyltransferase